MRVLLATDGSKDAQAATAFLKELPLPPLSEVRIAAVVPLPSFVLDVPRVREFKRSALEDIRRIVEDACASLAPRGFGIETDVAVGDPKEEIIRMAEEWGADLVVLGARGLSGYTAYSASKGGIIALTKTLAVEWARHNIQVNAIAPGWFLTPMNAHAFADDRIRDRLLREVPARRVGKAEELGPLVVYLASSASDFMTGEVVFIDGGQLAG